MFPPVLRRGRALRGLALAVLLGLSLAAGPPDSAFAVSLFLEDAGPGGAEPGNHPASQEGALGVLPREVGAAYRQLLGKRLYAEARQRALSELKGDAQNPGLLAVLALAEAGLGHWEAARRSVQSALSHSPRSVADDLTVLLGDILAAEGNREGARDAYQQVLAQQPNHPGALLSLALLAQRTGDASGAQRYFERLGRVKGAEEAALRGLLKIHLDRGDYTGLVRVARGVPAGSKSKPLADYFEGLALARRKPPQYPAAIRLLEKSLSASAQTPQVLYTLGYVHSKNRQSAAAVRRLKEAVALAPEFYEAQKLLGILFLEGGRPKEASEHLARALSLKETPDLRHLLGKAYLQQGRGKEGVAHLLRSLDSARLDPGQRSAVEGLYRYAGGDLSSSEAALRRALEKKPGASEARILLVMNLLRQAKLREAAAQAREGLRRRPEQRVLLLNLLAHAAMAGGDLDQAEQALGEALKNDPNEALTRVGLAGVYFRRAQYPKAQAELEAVLKRQPHNLDARIRLARVFQAAGDPGRGEKTLLGSAGQPHRELLKELVLLHLRQREHGKALEYAERLVRASPGIFDGYLLRSEVLASMGSTTEAVRSLDAGIEKSGESAETLEDAAKLSALNGWHDRAVHYLSRLRSQFGLATPQLKELYATELIAAGKTREAREIATRELDPADPERLYLIARSYIKDGNQAKAEEYLDRALDAGMSSRAVDAKRSALKVAVKKKDLQEELKANPSDPAAYEALALLEERRGDVDAAIKAYEGGLGKAGNDVGFLVQIGRLYLKNEPRRAIEYAERALAQRGNSAQEGGEAAFRAYAVLGTAWAQLGEAAKAEEALTRATAPGSRIDAAYYQLAKLKADLGDSRAAAALLKSAIQLNPGADVYRLALAAVHGGAGRTREAAAVLEEGLAKNPRSVPLLNNLALHYLDAGAVQKASTHAEKARRLAPEDPNVLDTAGWVCLKSNVRAKAIPYLKQAVDRAPQYPLYRYHLGLAYYETGALEKAKTELETALASGKDAPWTADLRRVLSAIASRQRNAPAPGSRPNGAPRPPGGG